MPSVSEAKVGTLLKKQNGRLLSSQWRRCSLLLDGSSIYCFRKAPDLTPLGRILMADAQIQVREAECAIFLTVLVESRIYQLTAGTVEEMSDWARAFELSSHDKAVVKMGFLRREVLGSWGSARTLWFVLDRGALFYFKRPPDFAPSEVLPLERSLSCLPSDDDAHASAFTLLSGGARWTLRAGTAAERDEWLHAIGAALDALPRADATAPLPPPRRGWLLKRTEGVAGSGLLPVYRPRYVVVEGNSLSYYSRPSDCRRGVLRLVAELAAATVEPPTDGAPADFVVREGGGGGAFFFRADDAAGAAAWVEWILEAIACQRRLLSSVGEATLAARALPPPSGLHTLRVASAASGEGSPCVSAAAFDVDAPPTAAAWLTSATLSSHSSSGSSAPADEAARCVHCAPQAARWRCNARLVAAFGVVWRRVGADGEAGEVLHSEKLHVVPDRKAIAADSAVWMAECFSAYMPCIDDVGYQLQVAYTPHAVAALPAGTPGSSLKGEAWRTHYRRSRCVVAANAEVEAQVDAALAKGAAEFLVVSRVKSAGALRDSWCELRLSADGARLRSLDGPLGFLGVGETKTVRFGDAGEGDATVVLPADLLQARISGAEGVELVVQAENAFLRDCIVLAMRRFKAVAAAAARAA
ncbi:hypothetical protein AB1Y20_009171 [Prymnesium parvum]|uniref:PH domain-containing protein n=1 Tax=Prymnesium parvum TaxID=97485 RepID=A0AB34K3K6_PRYPA